MSNQRLFDPANWWIAGDDGVYQLTNMGIVDFDFPLTVKNGELENLDLFLNQLEKLYEAGVSAGYKKHQQEIRSCLGIK